MTTKAENTALITSTIYTNPSGDITPLDFRTATYAIADLDNIMLGSTERAQLVSIVDSLVPDNSQNEVSVADQKAALYALVDAMHNWVQGQGGTSDDTALKASIDTYAALGESIVGQDTQDILLEINAEIADNWAIPGAAGPTAVDDAYVTPESTTLTVAAPGVMANDLPGVNQNLSVNPVPVGGTNQGELTLNADGSFEYIPNPGQTEGDNFTYQLIDGAGLTDTATVSITVVPNPNLVPFYRFRGDESDVTKAQWDAYLATIPPDESSYRAALDGGYANSQGGLDLDGSGTTWGNLGTNKGFTLCNMAVGGKIDIPSPRRKVTLTNATNRVNNTAHGLSTNAGVRFTAGPSTVLPPELGSPGDWHYVINETADDFQISKTVGGPAVTFTTDGTDVEMVTAHKYDSSNHWQFYSQGSNNDTDTTTRDTVFADVGVVEQGKTDYRWVNKDVMLEAHYYFRATGVNPDDWDSQAVMIWEQYHGGQMTYNWVGQSTASMAIYVANYSGAPMIRILHQGCTDPRSVPNRSYSSGGGYSVVADINEGYNEDTDQTVPFTFQTEQDYRLRIRRRADWTGVNSYFGVWIQPGSWAAGVWTPSGDELRIWHNFNTNQLDGSQASNLPAADKPAVQTVHWGWYLTGDTGGIVVSEYSDYLVTNGNGS